MMKKVKSSLKGLVYLYITGLALITASCSDNPVNNNDDDDNTPPEELFVHIATHTTDQHQYKVYAPDSLKTGHNELYIKVENSQGEEASVQNPIVTPLMYMADMTHSTPVSDVEEVQKEGNTYLKVDVYFIMASMGDEYWALKIEGETGNGTAIEEEITVDVAGGGLLVNKKIDDRTYYLSYVQPKVPVVGGDTYEIALHYMEDMMHFPPETEATVKINPYMDMGGGEGHGPTSFDEIATGQGGGRYSGNIVYNMAGEWQLTFTATLDDGTEISFSTLEITVEQ